MRPFRTSAPQVAKSVSEIGTRSRPVGNTSRTRPGKNEIPKIGLGDRGPRRRRIGGSPYRSSANPLNRASAVVATRPTRGRIYRHLRDCPTLRSGRRTRPKAPAPWLSCTRHCRGHRRRPPAPISDRQASAPRNSPRHGPTNAPHSDSTVEGRQHRWFDHRGAAQSASTIS
jgi:hypothetical protein